MVNVSNPFLIVDNSLSCFQIMIFHTKNRNIKMVQNPDRFGKIIDGFHRGFRCRFFNEANALLACPARNSHQVMIGALLIFCDVDLKSMVENSTTSRLTHGIPI